MKNTLKRALLVGGASLALILGVGTSPASASSDGPTVCNAGACVWFKNNGDYIYVQDTDADGHSAVAQVCVPSLPNCDILATNVWNTAGSGTTIYYGFGTDIPENQSVYYRACTGESSSHTFTGTCSGWTHGTS